MDSEFKTYRLQPIPVEVNESTSGPKSRTASGKYTDAPKWQKAHGTEVDQLYAQKDITWLTKREIPPNCKPIRLKYSYRYQTDDDGTVNSRKAICSIRGGLMALKVRYDSDNTASFEDDKSSIRTLLFHAAASVMKK